MTVTFPETFIPGFMGFATELEFMIDFAASMRDSGLKRFPQTYAELVAKQSRPLAQPTNYVPSVAFPSEGGDDIIVNGQIRSASAMTNNNGATYEGPKDLNYEKKFGKAPGTRSGRGIVHSMSPAQRKFLLTLLEKKDTRELSTRMVRGWTLDPTLVDTISKQHARPFIDALIACPDKAPSDSTKITIKGSDKQIAYMRSLATQRNLTDSDISDMLPRCQYYAGNVISELLAMPKVNSNNTAKAETLSEGMYVSGERIFKVYENQEHTRILCKELIDGSFEYLGMAQYKLPKDARKMTLDEAKHYGKVTGTCCVCSRRLTDEVSINAGIGPVCATRF